jgi:predicted SAM-dependent methyltransferase
MGYRIGSPALRLRAKQIPVVRHARRSARRLRGAYYRHFGAYNLSRMLAGAQRKRIVIGAWGRYDAGWIPTQKDFLNLVEAADWERFFQPGSVDAMLAEHVCEHLTPDEAAAAARICFKFLRPGGCFQVAVPDGLHPDPAYIELVKAGSPVPNDHKVLYTYRTLPELFQASGFRVRLYEYFDEAGVFHRHDWDDAGGTISRSKRFDPPMETEGSRA